MQKFLSVFTLYANASRINTHKHAHIYVPALALAPAFALAPALASALVHARAHTHTQKICKYNFSYSAIYQNIYYIFL